MKLDAMRPTVLSIAIGVLFLALSGPMALLATVGGDSCIDSDKEPVPCENRLVEQGFWLKVTASAVSSVAGPWEGFALLLLPAFGVPILINSVKKRVDDPTA